MLDNKKAQLGDTMTWVVATLVIIVVLGILVFVTIGISGNKSIYLDDKEKDFIATKSIRNFLSNDVNVGFMEKTLIDKNDKFFEEKVKKLLEILPTSTKNGIGSFGDWDFQLYTLEGTEKRFIIFDIKLKQTIPTGMDLDSFDTKISFKEKLNLKFSNLCLIKCR